MVATLRIPLDQIQMFFLVLLRVSVILVMLPIFDSRNIPPMLKAGLSFAVALVLFPLLNLNQTPFVPDLLPFALGATAEVVLGLAIGLSVRMLFAGIQLAGQLAGFQMGFSVVNVMDPQNSGQVSIIAQLNYLIAIVIFLSINAHHWFLYALAESFTVIPPLGFHVSRGLTELIMTLAADMFTVAIRIGAPVMVALLLTSAALGVVARTVPQMNIFIVAFPVKIAVGIVFLMLTLPYLSAFLQEVFSGIGQQMMAIVRSGVSG